MIQNFLVPELRRCWLNQFRIWFQQDGATAHTPREAMAELWRLFPGKLISHRGDVLWPPPHSPDLSPCDFFLWGYLKRKVYVDKPWDIPQLQNAIERDIRAIPCRMCEQVMTNFSCRLNECVQNKGHHLNDIIFHVWQYFFKYSYVILKLQHLLYLLKKLKHFFMKIDYALLLLKLSDVTGGPCTYVS